VTTARTQFDAYKAQVTALTTGAVVSPSTQAFITAFDGAVTNMDTAVATYMTEVNTAIGANTHKVAYDATETAFGNVITTMGANATCTAEKLCRNIHAVYVAAQPDWTNYITKKLALAQLANSNKAMELSASAHPWTLHGLWPTDIAPIATALATDFTPTVKAAVEPVIAASWPNCMPPPAGTSASNHMRKFWQHEWANHGIYYRGRSPASYVEDAVHLLAIKREFCTQAVKKLAATPVPQASLAAGRDISITVKGLTALVTINPSSDCLVRVNWADEAFSLPAKKSFAQSTITLRNVRRCFVLLIFAS
jgi:hypothetical protein